VEPVGDKCWPSLVSQFSPIEIKLARDACARQSDSAKLASSRSNESTAENVTINMEPIANQCGA
jgi:hypothetical protein